MSKSAKFAASALALLVCLAAVARPALAEDGDDIDQLRREMQQWKAETDEKIRKLQEENAELHRKLDEALASDDDELSPELERKIEKWFNEQRANSGLLRIDGSDGNFIMDVHLFGGIRERLEMVNNFSDFDNHNDDRDNFVDSRIRLGVALEFQDWVDVLFELQNNHYFGDSSSEFGSNLFNDSDDIEVYQAFINFRKFLGKEIRLRIGRQEIVKGTQFLVGNDDFYSGLSFDAVRLTYDFECLDLELDAWWARLSDNYGTATGDTRYNDDDRDFWGLYLTWRGIHEKVGFIDTIEAYLLFVSDQTGNINNAVARQTNLSPDGSGYIYVNDFVGEDRYTVGTAVRGHIMDTEEFLLQYNFEFAFQFGDAGSAGPFDPSTGRQVGGSGMSGGEIKAFALEASIRYQIRKWKLKPAFTFSYSYATGDDNPYDEDQGTFNPLFQNRHKRLGRADMFRTENLHALGFEATINPLGRLELGGALYYFILDSKNDFAAPDAVAPLMGENTHIGGGLAWEMDLFLDYQYSQRVNVQIVYSRVFMGGAVGDNLRYLRGRGSDDDVSRFYINIVFKY